MTAWESFTFWIMQGVAKLAIAALVFIVLGIVYICCTMLEERDRRPRK